MGDAKNIIVENKVFETKKGKLPKEFGPANLTNLFVGQFVTWDEVQRRFIPGYDDGYIRSPHSSPHLRRIYHMEALACLIP